MAGKADIVNHLAESADLTKAKAGDVVDALIEYITDTLASGDKVQIAGFGTFTVAERAARTGRNPRTGESLEIAASKNVKFKPGSQLKDAVN